MDSDHDSGNSDDAPIHRRRTQGTRPPPATSTPTASSVSQASASNVSNVSAHRMSTTTSGNVDHTYRPSKDDEPYSDDDELDEDEEEEDDEHQRRHPAQATYRGRGRPSQQQQQQQHHHQQQQQHLMDSSYDDDGDHQDLPRYTGPLREQDRFLPIANIAKIMKKGVPEKGKIAKDAKETIQECVSEFISFITSEASDRCLQEKRKTINGEDILLAMLTLGFDSYIEPLRTFLTKVRDASKYDRTITMGGELTDDLRVQVAQAQSNQTVGPMVQAQVATKIQVQPQSTVTSVPLPAPTIAAKPTGTTANPNGLEPYGHSVRVVTCIRNDQPGENPNYIYTIQPYQ